MIKGAVPGSKGGWVTVKDAVKKKAPEGLPLPAALRSQLAPVEEAPQEEAQTEEAVVEEAVVEEAQVEAAAEDTPKDGCDE